MGHLIWLSPDDSGGAINMALTNQTLGIKDAGPHWATFERFERQVKQPSWLFPLRKAAMTQFAALGFPTQDLEDWRFTSVAPIAKLPFQPVLQPIAAHLTAEALSAFAFAQLPAARLVFADGHFLPALSSTLPAESGVVVSSLADALAAGGDLVKNHLAGSAPDEFGAFAALNLAFFQDGAFIHVPHGIRLETPIHLLFLTTTKDPGATSHPRNLIVAGPNSHLTVLETYASLTDAPTVTNAVTDLVVADGAQVEHCKFQDERAASFHIAATRATLGRACHLIAHSIATGARLSRNNIRIQLAGEGAECILNGLYLTRGVQLADHHMVVEHAQPRCQSHEYYNGILDGRSKGVFHGRILVRQAAQKTDAKQTNKNLLLSDDATIDSKPQLEIYADDVKCTHGATVGQLNEESIFYLRARGIGAQTARHMLIHAFAAEIIDRIRHLPARAELNQLVWDRLEANPRLAAPL